MTTCRAPRPRTSPRARPSEERRARRSVPSVARSAAAAPEPGRRSARRRARRRAPSTEPPSRPSRARSTSATWTAVWGSGATRSSAGSRGYARTASIVRASAKSLAVRPPGERVREPRVDRESRDLDSRHDAALQPERMTGGGGQPGEVVGLGRAEVAFGVGVRAHTPRDALGNPRREELGPDLMVSPGVRSRARGLAGVEDERWIHGVAADVVQQARELQLLVGARGPRELGALQRVLQLRHSPP